MNSITRLHEAIAAVCPIFGVSGDESLVRIDYDPSATAGQKAAAEAALAAFDWSAAAEDAWGVQRDKTLASSLMDAVSPDVLAIIIRALALLTMDELNVLRAWIASFKAEVAAATSLADLKTRVAALPATPQRTKAQIFPALQSRVASADVG